MTAAALNIDEKTVHNILLSRGVTIKPSTEVVKEKYSIPVLMFDLNNNYLRTFSSSHEAAKYMIANNLTGCKHSTIR